MYKELKMEERTSIKGFMLGLLAGGVVGGLTALLYAPKSGKEFRKDIGKKSKEIYSDTEEYISSAKTRASEIISDGRKKAEDLISDAKLKAASIVSSGKDFVAEEAGKIKDAVRSGIDTYNEERKQSKVRQ